MTGSVEVPPEPGGPGADGQPPYGTPAPARRPASRGRQLLVRLLLLVLVVGGVTAYRISRVTTSTGSVGVGDCVKKSGADEIVEARCSSKDAFGKVIDKHKGASFFGADCPDDADTAARYSVNATVCIRNLAGPHPSDPGAGGGNLRPGDCVGQSGSSELECGSDKAYGKVAALAADAGGCPGDAVRSTTRTQQPTVVCVAPGPVPICYDDPSTAFGGNVVACDTSGARLRVASRAATAEQCPPGSATYDDQDALPQARFQCLEELPAH